MRILPYFIVFFLFSHSLAAQTASFNTSKEKDCNILKVQLNASASTGVAPLVYYWDFGNGNTTSGADKSVVDAIYVQPGTPRISLYVVDGSGAKSEVVYKNVTILAGPKVDFTTDISSACSGKEISFINHTNPGSSAITGYIWNVGSSITLQDPSPKFVFYTPGSYDVTLTVTDANGCNVSAKKESVVTIQNKFDAYFQATKTFECATPFQTRFNDYTDYTKVYNHELSYLWLFGDGTRSTLQHPEKTFTKPGSYTVGFYVTDHTEGCVARREFKDYITVGGRKPYTSISFTERKCTDFLYHFDPNSDNLPDNIVKSIDFGDGEVRNFVHYETFFHTYTKPGKYIVKTTYADPGNSSCEQEGFDTISIADPHYKILSDKTTGCQLPMNVKFGIDKITDGAFYLWDFGDGVTSQEKTPTHTYQKKGKFTVGVKVWTTTGCSYSLLHTDLISTGAPTAYFTSDAKRIEEYPREYRATPIQDSSTLWGGCVPFKVNFKNLTPALATGSYQWDFGDGSVSTDGALHVAHTYQSEGIFSPKLTVNYQNGCTDTYQCTDCVRAGKPPVADVTTSGPDTVCCEYDKTFEANVSLDQVDLLWYNISLNDGAAPPGITKAYYKDSTGKWILENHTEEFFPYQPEGMGLRYMTTNLSKPNGNQPDFYFQAYKNGCAKKIEYKKYQHHVLPWGTFSPLPCEVTENLKAGDTLDFNKVDGIWFIGNDTHGNPMKLAKAVVTFELSAKPGCTMPLLEQTFTPASLGFEMDKDAYRKIQQANLFAKIVLPACVSSGDQIITSTYLYNHESATKQYQHGKCLCEEHWPYLIGASLPPDYEVSNRSGCSPLNVVFKAGLATTSIHWTFEDGTIVTKSGSSHVFDKPGKYRFKASSGTCAGNAWTDSIMVYPSPVAKLYADRTTFCLNPSSKNDPFRRVSVRDSSGIAGDSIVSRRWIFGTDTLVEGKANQKEVLYNFSSQVLHDSLSKKFISLEVVSSHGCHAADLVPIVLRYIHPDFSMVRFTGCFDTLKLLPLFPNLGNHPPYNGNMIVNRYDLHDTILVYKSSLQSTVGQPVLLDRNGVYNVQMEITGDALGPCYASSPDSLITVEYASLQPDFVIKGPNTFSCVPAMVYVNDTSRQWKSHLIQTWDWKFTNLKTGMEIIGKGKVPPPFALNDQGYYNLSLQVTDKAGCTRAILKDSVILIDELSGRIDTTSPPLCPGEEGMFLGTSSNADFFFWDFGDGTVSSGLSVKHRYVHGGEKNIVFIIADSANCRKSYVSKILVKDAPEFNLPNDTLLCTGQQLSIVGPLHPAYKYNWNTSETISKVLIQNPGLYTLTVHDSTKNCPYTDSIKVSYTPVPMVKIRPVKPVCIGEDILMEADFDSTTVSKNWRKNFTGIGNQNKVTMKADSAYWVRVIAFNKHQCVNSDSIQLPILQRPRVKLQDKGACPQDSAQMMAEVTLMHPGFTFSWTDQHQNTISSITPALWVSQPQQYTVTYGKPGCYTSATAKFYLHSLPDTSTNESIIILCDEEGEKNIDGGVASSYLWQQSQATNRFLSVDTLGIYALKIGNSFGCFSIDTVKVINRCAPKIFVPNAFTPDLEGENKVHTVFGYNIGKFEYMVYNRWGELIYKTNDLSSPWDGTYRAEVMPSGVYPWMIRYTGNNPDYTRELELQGKVTVVR